MERESLDGGIRLSYPLGKGVRSLRNRLRFPPGSKTQIKNTQEPPAGARGSVRDGTALPAASTTGFLWDIFKQIPVNPPNEAKLGENGAQLGSGKGERGEKPAV